MRFPEFLRRLFSGGKAPAPVTFHDESFLLDDPDDEEALDDLLDVLDDED